MTNQEMIIELDSIRTNVESVCGFIVDLKAMVKLVQLTLDNSGYEFEEIEPCIGSLSIAEDEFDRLHTKLIFTLKNAKTLIGKISEEMVKEQLNDR